MHYDTMQQGLVMTNAIKCALAITPSEHFLGRELIHCTPNGAID